MQTELILEADSSIKPNKSPNGAARDSCWLKTSPVFSVHTKGPILHQWLESWLGTSLTYREKDGQIPVLHLGRKDSSNGVYWTRNTSTWRNGGSACLLSGILETGKIDRRYYLSPRACAGILRRAERRGKILPPALKAALESVSGVGRQDSRLEQVPAIVATKATAA